MHFFLQLWIQNLVFLWSLITWSANIFYSLLMAQTNAQQSLIFLMSKMTNAIVKCKVNGTKLKNKRFVIFVVHFGFVGVRWYSVISAVACACFSPCIQESEYILFCCLFSREAKSNDRLMYKRHSGMVHCKRTHTHTYGTIIVPCISLCVWVRENESVCMSACVRLQFP